MPARRLGLLGLHVQIDPHRLAKARGGEIDFVVVRENTEGEYAQVGGFVYHMQPEEVAALSTNFLEPVKVTVHEPK